MKDTENADLEQISDSGSAAGSTVKKSKTKKKKKKKVADEVECEIAEREDSLEVEARRITELKQLR